MKKLEMFEHQLRSAPAPVNSIAQGEIGKGIHIETPFGRKPLIYADYVASGRALQQVEDFILQNVLPYYANSHTEQSHCGAAMTQMREEARAVIADKCGSNPTEHAVIFGGSGATTGLNQLVHLFDVKSKPSVVLVGPYEHHSNLLPWRESGATVIEINEAPDGGVDLADLQATLRNIPRDVQIIGAFSAASNVTGVCTDPTPVTQAIKEAGGKVVWDYAGGGPYLPMSMAPGGVAIDAMVCSPHKFLGGPGGSGVLIVRRDAVQTQSPSRPGGGTVVFVNETTHDYVARLEQREEGGTPNVIGDIRAALAMIVKDVVGNDAIAQRNQELSERVFQAWSNVPGLHLLAPENQTRLPIFSFVPTDAEGVRFDYKDFTRALSDHYGIQARGGCSCAGPYVHRLLSISDETSAELRADLLAGDDKDKPGFVRLNFSYMMDEETVTYVLEAIPALISAYRAKNTVAAA
ncbi:aminotransferase class V-fold PLP-dependent enzyme [Cognatishimia sp.]|uniref:aminotransferase class V-fold PLP-dependent enzyme n=1 Tax=Cognatishimia sp. TaxID=2211648 RepID=UPI00351692CD